MSGNRNPKTIADAINTINIKTTMRIGKVIGDTTHHQDQSITSVNFSTIKTINVSNGTANVLVKNVFIRQR